MYCIKIGFNNYNYSLKTINYKTKKIINKLLVNFNKDGAYVILYVIAIQLQKTSSSFKIP